ncbi:MAG: glycosyltransferase [Deltaproteobacteria bacterium]|nr:glycosyltransferase [Deltaproteobacteria bacterium]
MLLSSNRPTISIIIPVHNGGENFRRCLLSLKESYTAPEEIIVVADGESDGSWRIAKDFDTEILEISSPGGPSRARNLGARKAKGDILFFVDADVAISKDAVGLISYAFQQEHDLAAAFGSYDDEPFETNFLSQYKNLFHHYVHQTSNEEASTFWGACGAIRRDIFLENGGFNEKYRFPSIEDIELGYRLKKAGYRIRLIKQLYVKHLKHWGFLSLVKADFLYRAVAWTRLILKERLFLDDLNLKISSRISVFSVCLMIFMLAGTSFSPWLLLPAMFFAVLLLILNKDLYGFFQKRRGWLFVLKTIPWHWFYFFYSGLAFLAGFIDYQIGKFKK